MLSNDHMHECKDENGLYKTNETTNPSSPASTPSQPSNAVEENADLIQVIRAWLKQLTYREGRRFLEAHSELLTPRTDDVLMRLIVRYAKNEEAVQDFQDHLALLRDARRRGGTVAAIGEAYIDIYDGCMLDLPQWLEEIERRLIDLHKIEPSSQTVAERRDLLDKAIVYAMSDERVAPETLAELLNMLGGTLGELASEDPKFYEEAIQVHRQALQIYTLARYPRQFALTQRRLGNIYYERIDGERRFNLEQSITCHEAALQVYTRDTFPIKRAMMQFNLGNIYRKRIEGERRSNLERTIFYFEASIQVYTHDVFPIEWAMLQHNLGVAYSDRIEGERRSNLEQAIACYEAALQIRTYNTYPIDWARTQYNMGIAFRERLEGERRANLERAIACYQATLKVYTREAFPEDWARTQLNLGNAYSDRLEGEQRANLERAIACYEAALQVCTREAFPEDWAKIQRSLGGAYFLRLEGKQKTNLERAIACYEAALQVCAREALPREWAAIQHNIGVVYCRRIEGERKDNLERAIACCEAALQVCTRDTFPEDWASIQHDLGIAYLERFEGERRDNLERAIACYEAALQIRTPDSSPNEWGVTQLYLGMTYYARLEGKQKDNLEQAIACYRAALKVYTRDAFPHEHRIIQLNRTNAEAKLQNWEGVHASCAEALAAEDALIRLGAGAVGHDIILKEGSDAASYDGFALTRLGQVGEAAVVIENRRAHGLAQTLTLDAGSAEQIRDMGRRTRYEDALRRFIKAQAALNDPISRDLSEDERRQIILERTDAYHRAMKVFEVVITEIRAAQDPPDFLENTLSTATILHAAESGGRGHALVYLVATPWGGIAVTALNTDPHLDASARFTVLDLPHLTNDLVRSLFETKIGYTSRIIGGYNHAQEGNGWSWLRKQWPGETFRQSAEALYAACTAAGQVSTLAAATQRMLGASTLAHLVDQPFDQLDASALTRLRNTLEHLFLQLELQRCLELLAKAAMQSLVAWLFKRGATSLTLIPCGTLAALPLAAVKLADGRTVGETLPTSTAISARSLLHDKHEVRKRAGVYAFGDPRPTGQELQWGEAEAHTLVKLAHSVGLPGEARVHNKAVRSWLIQVLRTGCIVDASCHGAFDANDFLQSSLQLARGKRLTLAEALNREVDLRGLRLLILSACQTAILDLRGARDEVRSLAAGMIQAGAQAVLGSLWPVDDKATYLLIVRFAQEWLPRMEQEPPAAALARAQHWLRTVTNRELQQWHTIDIPMPTVWERREAGSVMPERDPWVDEEKTPPLGVTKLAEVRGRGDRYDIQESESLVRIEGINVDNLDARPYADPIYWAGFQIIGW